MKKKLLTFLGSSNYKETIYLMNDIEVKTHFVQEAIYKALDDDLEVIVFITNRAKQENWYARNKDYKGLKEVFDANNIKYKAVDIYDGENDEEMWKNFDIIFDTIEEEEEIYLDITHSFRSIPIIFMSVLNYSKFIKNISLNGVYYGAYDATQGKRTPIFDLNLFNKLTEWTIGAEKLISAGDGELFSSLISKTIEPILKKTKGKDECSKNIKKIGGAIEKYTYNLKASRGLKISETGFDLKGKLLELKEINLDELKPFEKIIDKVLEKVNGYSNEDIVKDIHHTVCLCRDYNLLQQAFTLLRENIINYVCTKADLPINNKKINGVNSRKIAEKILISFHYIDKKKVKLSDIELDIKEKLEPNIDHKLADFFKQVGDFRNDLNHGGYREHPLKYSMFCCKLDEYIVLFEEIILQKELYNASNN